VGGYFTMILVAELGVSDVLGPGYMVENLFKGFYKS
jgi:hypothetical protein